MRSNTKRSSNQPGRGRGAKSGYNAGKSNSRKPSRGKTSSFKKREDGEKESNFTKKPRFDREERVSRGKSDRFDRKSSDRAPRRESFSGKREEESRSPFAERPLSGRSRRTEFGDLPKEKPQRRSADDRPERSERPKRSFDRDEKRPTRSFSREENSERPKRSFDRDEKRPTRSFSREENSDRPKRSFNSEEERPKRSFSRDENSDRPKRSFDRDDKPKRAFSRDENSDRPKRSFDRDDKPKRSSTDRRSPIADRSADRSTDHSTKKTAWFGEDERKPRTDRSSNRSTDRRSPIADRSTDRSKWNRKESHEFFGDKKKKFSKTPKSTAADDGLVRLNKFIANAGICSRREADELIKAGVISVNGNVVTEMGFKVGPGDNVKYNNALLRGERLQYILLNKPKDFITTTDDPDDRKTVMSLIARACKERVYPVGRLDRNTTGVLLFTNDGDLAKKLTHPSFQMEKVYQVELDKNLKQSDFEAIEAGLKLEDGPIKVDHIVYGQEKNIVGVELHSGKNRIVRRIFEHLGYEVKKLDRVVFAGLTKKDLPRGRWRFLTEMEIANLKMITGKKLVTS